MANRTFFNRSAGAFLSKGTLAHLRFDLLRLRTRLRTLGQRDLVPPVPRLHFGCGATRIPGWLNVDVVGSEQDVDLAAGKLPWADDVFDVGLSQHVIEHLELKSELLPLLEELWRVLKPGGKLWLSCPDIEKICRSYLDNRMIDLIEDRQERSRKHWDHPWSLDRELGLDGVPPSQMINSIFYQRYEHRNLFDFELLRWLLEQSGFGEVQHVDEGRLRDRYPEVPLRGDDAQSLYVVATALEPDPSSVANSRVLRKA